MKMNGDKISEKKVGKKIVGPELGSTGPKNVQYSRGPVDDNTFLFWLQFFFCDTSSLYKFTDIGFLSLSDLFGYG